MNQSAPVSTQKFVPFFIPSIGKEEEEAALRVLRSSWLTTGKEALAFEKEFEAFLGAPVSALAVNSATSGLLLAYDACGIGSGTKILTTPYTFASTATAALHLGAEIAYADIEADTYSIDPVQIQRALDADPGIRAIVPVHIGGNLCNMEEITHIARQYGVYVIEDAAHALPSRTQAGAAGSLGDAGVFSFYATKTITTAEGGMVCFHSEDLAERARLMRLHGIDRPVWDRYTAQRPSWEYDVCAAGWKCNMPDLLAAIGRAQLKKADSLRALRAATAEKYNAAFSEYDFLRIPPNSEGNAWHLYILRIRGSRLKINRNAFARALSEAGLGISVHFIPHHRLSFFKNRYQLSATDFPHAETQFNESISIPLWPGMDAETEDFVINTVIETGKRYYVR